MSGEPQPPARPLHFRNAYTLISYLTEMAGTAEGKVVVDRAALREVIRLAKTTPKYTHARKAVRQIGQTG